MSRHFEFQSNYTILNQMICVPVCLCHRHSRACNDRKFDNFDNRETDSDVLISTEQHEGVVSGKVLAAG